VAYEVIKSSNSPVPQPSNKSFLFLACYQLWRFLPDLMSISIGFLMSTLGDLYSDQVGTNLWFVILPTVFLAYFIVHLLQTGSARYNFSRFFLECAPIATMGYASYAIYLFQRIAFTFYAPAFYFGVQNHNLNIKLGNPNNWFEKLNGGYKVIAVVVLTIVCWLVHRYYQDGFITYLYAKFLQRNSGKMQQISAN
jgi:peptidoglycan/LPS O-acetylase OafA/YrhL